MRQKSFIPILFIVIVCLTQLPATGAERQDLILTTATTGGTYYPVGVAVGTLATMKLGGQHINVTAINSAGSGENIQMLKNGEAQLAILQGIFGAQAYSGRGMYEGRPFADFRSITTLWENVEHFVLLQKYVKTGTIDDLKNLDKKFSIGKRGSGTEGSGEAILQAVGIQPGGDFVAEYLGYTPSAMAMIDGRIAGANIPAGPPASAVTQLYAQLGEKKVKVLEFTDKHLALINKEYPIWDRFVIPKGMYPGQYLEIKTISQPNFLAARADVPDETVYLLTKTIYENLPFLHDIHQATRSISLDRALRGLPVPLHPGAVRYYREQGIEIPQQLLEEK
jgi:TRAP transporter TAXI family solute receptor